MDQDTDMTDKKKAAPKKAPKKAEPMVTLLGPKGLRTLHVKTHPGGVLVFKNGRCSVRRTVAEAYLGTHPALSIEETDA